MKVQLVSNPVDPPICIAKVKGEGSQHDSNCFSEPNNNMLSSVTSPSGEVDDRLELQVHLTATCPVLLC